MKTFVAMALAFVVTILAGKWFYETVMGTDWPNWVKYMILR